MSSSWLRIAWAAAILALAAGVGPRALAQEKVDEQQIVNRALGTVERLRTDEKFRPSFEAGLAKARAVLVVPDLYKGGFILGGEFGNGALLVRNPQSGWSYPAFYSLSGGSLGVQFGIEDVSIVFLILTEKGLQAVLQDKFKIGGEMQVAIGLVGGGEEAATTGALGKDIEAFALGAVGLYGALSLEGAVLTPRDTYDEAYYGKKVSARAIVLEGAASNAEADRLRDFLGK